MVANQHSSATSSFSEPLPITAVSTDDRWSRGGGVTSTPRCAEPGCPFPVGRCPDHQREQSGYVATYRWHGRPLPDMPPRHTQAELAAVWAAQCCEFGGGFPFIDSVTLCGNWRTFLVAYISARMVRVRYMHEALQDAGAMPARVKRARNVSGYEGVRLCLEQ